MLVSIIIALRLFVGEVAVVPSESMEPTIARGSRIWIHKPAYGAQLPKRFADIPLLNVFTWIPFLRECDTRNDWGYHRLPPRSLPCRGDIIVFERSEHEEQWLVKRVAAVSGDTLFLHKGRLYINGHEQAQPCAPDTTLTFEPVYIPFRHNETLYFVLGDNRAHSVDSRTWGVVSERDVIGKAIVLFQ